MTEAIRSFPNVRFITVMTVAAIAACRENNPPSGPALGPNASTAQSAAGRAPQGRYRSTLDDRFALLANRVPGFGGVFYDSSGALTVQLTDPSKLGPARPHVEAFLLRETRGSPRARARFSSHVAAMRARKAKYDFRELLAAYRSHVLPAVMAMEEVTFTDIDEHKNRILVGVSSPNDIAAVRRVVASLPIPKGMVEVLHAGRNQLDAGGPAPPLAAPPLAASPLASSLPYTCTTIDLICRPVAGGLAIQYYVSPYAYWCTLGFNLVRWINDTIATNRYFVTNTHCGVRNTVSSNFKISQVQYAWGDTIGKEIMDPMGFTGSSSWGNCPPERTCRWTDAAVYKYDSASFANHGLIVWPNAAGSKVFNDEYLTVIDVQAPLSDHSASTVGHAGGLRHGTITHACTNILVDSFWTLCNGVANYASDSGDSGGPVFLALEDHTAWAFGIHWGKGPLGSFFSPMDGIITEFYDREGWILDPTTETVSPGPPGGGYGGGYMVQPDWATIYGPTGVKPNSECQWYVTSSISSPSYEWRVNGSLLGTGQYFTYTSGSTSFDLEALVTDGDTKWAVAFRTVNVDSNNGTCYVE